MDSDLTIVSFPASDLQKAREFYGSRLGLPETNLTPSEATYEAGEKTKLVIYKKEDNSFKDSTLGVFFVDDIQEEIAELRARGIDYNVFKETALQTKYGMTSLGGILWAWFSDPEGNILALVQKI